MKYWGKIKEKVHTPEFTFMCMICSLLNASRILAPCKNPTKESVEILR